MNKLIAGKRGSVSVFLLLTAVPLFLFHGMLIDLAGIKTADREAELAVKAGARSVLSRFDPALKEYGLYAASGDGDRWREWFRFVVKQNLPPGAGEAGDENRPGVMVYTDTRLEEDSVNAAGMHALANHQVLRRQILQEMKWVAPVEFALEMIDKFKETKTANRLEHAASFHAGAEILEQLRQKREEALDLAWVSAQSYFRRVMQFCDKYVDRLQQLHALAEETGLEDAETLRSSVAALADTIAALEAEWSELNGALATIQAEIERLSRQAAEDADRLRRLTELADDTRRRLQEVAAAVGQMAERKQTLEETLRKLLEYTVLLEQTKLELAADRESGAEAFARLQSRIERARTYNSQLRAEEERWFAKWRNQPTDLPEEAMTGIRLSYGDALFFDYLTETGKIAASYNGLIAKWSETDRVYGEEYRELARRLDELNALTAEVFAEQADFEARRKEREAGFRRDAEQQKRQLDETLDRVLSAFAGCAAPDAGDPYSAAYRRLESGPEGGLFGKYMRFNDADENGVQDAPYRIDDGGEAAAAGAMHWARRFAGLLEGFRDEVYINEYVLSRFEYRTSVRDRAAGGHPAISGGHRLANQEAEYILYGLPSCTLNYMAAYGEMYVLLLAVRTTEGLLEPKSSWLNAGSPYLLFLYAAAEGAVRAAEDLQKLIGGESVPLLRKMPGLTVRYKDLLRVFLLLHPSDAARMSRIQALVELNTGKDLTQTATYLQFTAKTSVRLRFIPALLRPLAGMGLADCDVRGNRCEMMKTVVVSYL